jgi:hypothetical protein
MRQMSFFYTQPQFRDGTKDLTRRKGWKHLKRGDRFMAIVKGQGLKPGEKVQQLGECECVSNRREPLSAITQDDVRREGFPNLNPIGFVEMFCGHMGGEQDQEVSRVEFKRVGELPTRAAEAKR